jgi:hypothetical protein
MITAKTPLRDRPDERRETMDRLVDPPDPEWAEFMASVQLTGRSEILRALAGLNIPDSVVRGVIPVGDVSIAFFRFHKSHLQLLDGLFDQAWFLGADFSEGRLPLDHYDGMDDSQ